MQFLVWNSACDSLNEPFLCSSSHSVFKFIFASFCISSFFYFFVLTVHIFLRRCLFTQVFHGSHLNGTSRSNKEKNPLEIPYKKSIFTSFFKFEFVTPNNSTFLLQQSLFYSKHLFYQLKCFIGKKGQKLFNNTCLVKFVEMFKNIYKNVLFSFIS